MVPPALNRLQKDIAAGLRAGGFRSWVGEPGDSASWMVRKFGDVYPHVTAIAHIRRLLEVEFPCTRLHETPTQFRKRVQKVEDHMNSDAFAAPDGNGLLGLAKCLRSRCEAVVLAQGERFPK